MFAELRLRRFGTELMAVCGYGSFGDIVAPALACVRDLFSIARGLLLGGSPLLVPRIYVATTDVFRTSAPYAPA